MRNNKRPLLQCTECGFCIKTHLYAKPQTIPYNHLNQTLNHTHTYMPNPKPQKSTPIKTRGHLEELVPKIVPNVQPESTRDRPVDGRVHRLALHRKAYTVSGFGFRVLGFGFKVSGLEFLV